MNSSRLYKPLMTLLVAVITVHAIVLVRPAVDSARASLNGQSIVAVLVVLAAVAMIVAASAYAGRLSVGWEKSARHLPVEVEVPEAQLGAGKLNSLWADNDYLKSEVARLSERLVGKGHESERLKRDAAMRVALEAARKLLAEEKLRSAMAEIERLNMSLSEMTAALAAVEIERDELKSRAEQASGDPVQTSQMAVELAEARQEIERLAALVPPRPVRLMEIAVATQKKHWGDNCDLGDKDTWPSQTGVWQWLESNYPDLSEQQRKAIEIVVRPIKPNSSTKI